MRAFAALIYDKYSNHANWLKVIHNHSMQTDVHQCLSKSKDQSPWEYALSDLSQSTSLKLCNSYTMGCPPVREDNPRALASGLSYVQVD